MSLPSRVPLLLVLGLLLLLPLGGCGSSGGGTTVPPFDSPFDLEPLDPQPFYGCPSFSGRQAIGTYKFTNTGDVPATFAVTVISRIGTDLRTDVVTAEPPDGLVGAGETVCIQLSGFRTDWSTSTLRVASIPVDQTKVQRDDIEVPNRMHPVTQSFARGFTYLDPEGPPSPPAKTAIGDETTHSNGLWSLAPEPSTDIILRYEAPTLAPGDVGAPFDFKPPASVAQKFFTPGTDALHLSPVMPMPMPAGMYFVLFLGVDEDIPQADPLGHYQYACVFDQDGDPANNYVPPAAFPNDYFGGTDLWYEVRYNPTDGWELHVTDARDNVFTPVASAAHAIVLPRGIMFLVPASELAAAKPTYRLTAFRHEGDFGLNPPHVWSANTEPRMGEPLRPITADE